MILIKLWWSIFAPKDKENFIDTNYLNKFNDAIKNIFKNENVILVHWTWNFWHWFVKKNWLNKNNFNDLDNILINFYKEIDRRLIWFKRVRAKELNNINTYKWNYIIWWDILNKNWNISIISSDDIFWKILSTNSVKKAIMMTDVDWVLNLEWKIIKEINSENIKDIYFWEKDKDATWSMRNKINSILEIWKKVLIVNWKEINVFKENINKEKIVWTIVN